jgi:hypothetical protein
LLWRRRRHGLADAPKPEGREGLTNAGASELTPAAAAEPGGPERDAQASVIHAGHPTAPLEPEALSLGESEVRADLVEPASWVVATPDPQMTAAESATMRESAPETQVEGAPVPAATGERDSYWDRRRSDLDLVVVAKDPKKGKRGRRKSRRAANPDPQDP